MYLYILTLETWHELSKVIAVSLGEEEPYLQIGESLSHSHTLYFQGEFISIF